MKRKVKITDWCIRDRGTHNILHGKVHGHPNFQDGTTVNTSEILKNNGIEVETRNTVYILDHNSQIKTHPTA